MCIKPSEDIIMHERYNSDEDLCVEDVNHVEYDLDYQIDDNEQDGELDEGDDCVASSDDDTSDVSEDDYDLLDGYDECDDSEYAVESDEDFYEVEDDDYEHGDTDDEDDGDTEYSEMTVSEKEELIDGDGEAVQKCSPNNVKDSSSHRKISFDLRDCRYVLNLIT